MKKPKVIYTVDNNWVTEHYPYNVSFDERGRKTFDCKMISGKHSALYQVSEQYQKVYYSEEEANERINPNQKGGFVK